MPLNKKDLAIEVLLSVVMTLLILGMFAALGSK